MKKIALTLCLMCFSAVFVTNLEAKLLPASGEITGGGITNDNYTDTFIDWIIPLIGSKNTFIFINPRASMTGSSLFGDDADELNAGAGIRHYSETLNVIFGINAYYDARKSQTGSKFRQSGAGVEFLSKWVDVRANGYVPVGDSEVKIAQAGFAPMGHRIVAVNQYEVSMHGFDCEAGLKIPFPEMLGQLKIFGGYYFFDSDKAPEAVKGAKGRIEYKPLNLLRLNFAMYENDKLNGSNWQAGADISIPVNLGNIFRNGSVFKGTSGYLKSKPKEVKQRMGEMVQRDMYVRTASAKITDQDDILKAANGDDIYFVVVSSNASAGGAGTFENPAKLDEAVAGNEATVEDNLTFLLLSGAYQGMPAFNFTNYLSKDIYLISPDGATYLGIDLSAIQAGLTGRASIDFNSGAGIVFTPDISAASQQSLTIGGIDLTGTGDSDGATGLNIANIPDFKFASGTLSRFETGANFLNIPNAVFLDATISYNGRGLNLENSGISFEGNTEFSNNTNGAMGGS